MVLDWARDESTEVIDVILIGMSGVSLVEHQKLLFKWAFGSAAVLRTAAAQTGAISCLK